MAFTVRKVFDIVTCTEKVSAKEEKKMEQERKKGQIQVFNQSLVLGAGGMEYVKPQALHFKLLSFESVLITD